MCSERNTGAETETCGRIAGPQKEGGHWTWAVVDARQGAHVGFRPRAAPVASSPTVPHTLCTEDNIASSMHFQLPTAGTCLLLAPLPLAFPTSIPGPLSNTPAPCLVTGGSHPSGLRDAAALGPRLHPKAPTVPGQPSGRAFQAEA